MVLSVRTRRFATAGARTGALLHIACSKPPTAPAGPVDSYAMRGEITRLPVETTARVLIGACTMATLGIGGWDRRNTDNALADIETITRRLLSGMS